MMDVSDTGPQFRITQETVQLINLAAAFTCNKRSRFYRWMLRADFTVRRRSFVVGRRSSDADAPVITIAAAAGRLVKTSS